MLLSILLNTAKKVLKNRKSYSSTMKVYVKKVIYDYESNIFIFLLKW